MIKVFNPIPPRGINIYKFKVRVTRLGFSEGFITVNADNKKDAAEIAMMEMADVDFKEYDQEKRVEPNEITEL